MERERRRGKKQLKLPDNVHRGGYKDLNKTHGTRAVEDNSEKEDLPASRTPCGDIFRIHLLCCLPRLSKTVKVLTIEVVCT